MYLTTVFNLNVMIKQSYLLRVPLIFLAMTYPRPHRLVPIPRPAPGPNLATVTCHCVTTVAERNINLADRGRC